MTGAYVALAVVLAVIWLVCAVTAWVEALEVKP